MSEYENGPMDTWKLSEVLNDDGSEDYTATLADMEDFFNKYLAPYLKYDSIYKKYNLLYVLLPDGSNFRLYKGGCLLE